MSQFRKVLVRVKRFIYTMFFMGLFALAGFFDWCQRLPKVPEVPPDKTGRIAVLTGGTRGIGKEVAKKLLRSNFTLIMGCRRIEDGEKVIQEARGEGIESGQARIYRLDVSSLKSVQEFASSLKNDFVRVHCLINNAGCSSTTQYETEDGYEAILATNYLGHFYLTHLLLPLLKTGGSSVECSRIISVTSLAHLYGYIDFDDIHKRNFYLQAMSYSQAKLAQVLFMNYLDRKLVEDNEHVRCYSVDPGVVNTDIFLGTYFHTFFWWLLPLLKTPEQGARSTVYACLDSDLEGTGGVYVNNCKVRGQFRKSTDESVQEKLYRYSVELVLAKNFEIKHVYS